jgi:hypothetical protein
LVGQLGILWVPVVVHLRVEEGQQGMVDDKGEGDNKELLHIQTDIKVFHT